MAEGKKPSHKATYSTDNRKGGYLVRVAGPHAGEFRGREVPVERRDGSTSPEKLTKLVWKGVDDKTGENVALYQFEARPRDEAAIVEW